jgi:UDP-glucose 4-epimerase
LNILVFGGTGFVGINIASALLARGHAVTLFDRGALPRAAGQAFASFGDRLNVIQRDITESGAVEATIARGFDAIILGAAITAGSAREAADPESILQVNLMAQVPILMAAHRNRVRRVVNLS